MAAIPVQAQPGFDPYSSADVGWFGSSIVHAASSAVSSVGHAVGDAVSGGAKGMWGGMRAVGKAVAPAVKLGLPYAQQLLGHTPFGMVGQAALGALSAGLKGGNLATIAEAAARGAMPDEIEAAVDLGRDALQGKNILRSALSRAEGAFIPGSLAHQGFRAAKNVLHGGNVTKAALGMARRGLGDEEARRAFDAAVGTAAVASRAARKAAAVPRFVTSRRAVTPRVPFRPLPQWLGAIVAGYAPRTPIGALWGHDASGLEENGTRYRVVSGDSPWKIATTITGTGNRWKELVAANPSKPRSADGNFKFLNPGELLVLPSSWLTFTQTAPATPATTVSLPGATAPAVVATSSSSTIPGLEQNGTRYRVVSGDSPWKIATKITGTGNRWKELVAANPSKPRAKDGNFKFLNPGELLVLPSSWLTFTQPAGAVQTTPVANAAAVQQARALLVMWGATDGANEAGPTNYGTDSADTGGTWSARDRLQCASFCNWRNRRAGTNLPTSGDLTDAVTVQLQAWAREHATATVATPAPVPTVPAVALPPVVASTPVTIPTVSTPVALPPVVLPPVVASTPATVPAATTAPTVAIPVGATPVEVVHMVELAISSGDLTVMASLAVELRRRGYIVEAVALEAAAAEQMRQPQPPMAADAAAILAQGLISRDPALMRASAKALRGRGFSREAAALDAAAAEIERGRPKSSGGALPVVLAAAAAALLL